jgi:hypothetical protein
LGVDTAKLTGVEIAGIMNALRVGFDEGIFQPPPSGHGASTRRRKPTAPFQKGDSQARQILLPRMS